MKKGIYFVLIILISACSNNLNHAYKALQKPDYLHTQEILQQELNKNPTSAFAYYLQAILFEKDTLSHFSTDSTYQSLLKSFTYYDQASSKDVRKMQKINISKDSILQHKILYDSLAFSSAIVKNDLESYQHFIDLYTTAPQLNAAILLRDSIAFEEAQTQDTYEGYKVFLEKYPQSKQAQNAGAILDLLVFKKETASNTLQSFEQFIEKYPASTAISKAEKAIYEIVTATHTLAAYDKFLKQYIKNSYIPLALEWIKSSYEEKKELQLFLQKYPQYAKQEETLKLITAETQTYIAGYENQKYGFFNLEGTWQITPQYDSLPFTYICESIKNENYFITYQNSKWGVVDKLGNICIPYQFEEIEKFQPHLFLVKQYHKYGLWHKGNFEILAPKYDSIQEFNNIFLKIKQNQLYGLATFNGKILIECKYEDIIPSGDNFILLKKGNKYGFATQQQVLSQLEGKKLIVKNLFDGYEKIDNFYFKVKNKEKYGIVDRNYRTVIPLVNDQIIITPSHWLTQNAQGWQFYNKTGSLAIDSTFENILYNYPYYGLKYQGKWAIIDEKNHLLQPFQYDSVAFFDQVYLYEAADKITVNFQGKKQVFSNKSYKSITAIRNKTFLHSFFILVENNQRKKGLYNLKGKLILPIRYDHIYILDNGLINAKMNGKNGLLDTLGKEVLPFQYEGIGELQAQTIPLLKSKKFGAFLPHLKTVIPPTYQAALQPYAPHKHHKLDMFIANQYGQYGMVDAQNKTVIPFAFEEIKFWNDTTALVKKNQQWYFQKFKKSKKAYISSTSSEYFIDIEFIPLATASASEILLQGFQNGKTGIWSNKKGNIIPPIYEEIFFKSPIFMGTQEIMQEENLMKEVTYIDLKGTIVRKQVFNSIEYLHITCEE